MIMLFKVRVETDLLKSINNKLGVLELVSKEIKEIKANLEMSDGKAVTMEKERNNLKGTFNTIETDVNELKKDNMFPREAFLGIQTRSMRENLVLKWYKRK